MKVTGLIGKNIYGYQCQLQCCFLIDVAPICCADVCTCLPYAVNLYAYIFNSFKVIKFFCDLTEQSSQP